MPPLRPQPRFPESDTQPFWDATKDHQLKYQTCDSCKEVIFYPRHHCPSCGSLDNTWNVSKGEGAVYTFSVIMQSRHPNSATASTAREAMPQSMTSTSPNAPTMMFDGLMSRCNTPREWANAIASATF